jgi:uncharacterized cofD-like protein
MMQLRMKRIAYSLVNLEDKISSITLYQHGASRWQHLLKWLTPGLGIKRWILLNGLGFLLVGLGLIVSIQMAIDDRLIQLIFRLLETVTQSILSSHLGILMLILGLSLIVWSQNRAIGAVAKISQLSNSIKLVDRLHLQRQLRRSPKIVAIGGGTGLSTLLQGLKRHSSNLTAIVTVADDGGSSGRLRQELGVLPPGDIRSCMTALADEEQVMTQLFRFRFQQGVGLEGHSLGNLFLAALSQITGDIEQAIAASSQLLGIQGRVLPATLSQVQLWADLADGRRIEGESQIPAARGQIRQMGCTPANPPALPDAIRAIETADCIILGPGSLYTSVIPNLLVPEIREAIAKATVPRIYICNIMTQLGETDNYSVSDHIQALDQACGQRLFDSVLVHQGSFSGRSLTTYAAEDAYPVTCEQNAIARMGCQVVQGKIMDANPSTGYIRHHPQRLAKTLLRWYNHHQKRSSEKFQRSV